MKVRQALTAIRFIGLGNVFRSVLYALRRDRWERQALPPQEQDLPGPGRLLHTEPLTAGARFRFEHASLEVVFLAPDLARLSWEPGTPPVPYAIAGRDWPAPRVDLKETAQGWRLASEALAVEVGREGAVRYLDSAGSELRREAPPQRQAGGWRHRADLAPEAVVCGLGERAAPLNLRPGRYRLWNQDPGGNYGPGRDPLYLTAPVYLCLQQTGAYLVFYENSHDGWLTFDEGAEAHFQAGMLRLYFIPGTPDRALERFTELTGRPPLPPRWALGFHQSRWGYGSAAAIREVVEGFRRHGLPLRAVHLDIDHLDGFRVFTSDPRRFPDLPGLVQDLEAQGVRVVTIVDPGVKRDPGYRVYREGLAQRAFCSLPDGTTVHAPVWPGWAAFPDFTHPRVRTWWGEQYRGLVQAGVAGFWHDMNEPTAFAAWGDTTLPRTTHHRLEGQGGDHGTAHNLYGLLMNRAAYEALRRLRPDRRPFLLTRSGWVGVQRYAWTWTGDVESTWEALRQTVATVLHLGLSGIPYSGPDIGGFIGTPDAELYLRWFQLAACLPFFRAHSALNSTRREPWAFGQEALEAARQAMALRESLMPYLYTLAWAASQTGAPLARPLFWPGASDPDLWTVDDTFLLGEALLVAPVLEPGARRRPVRLPAGRWYDFWADTPLEGPGEVLCEAPLERVPLLVRAGALLPRAEGEVLCLHLYLPAEGGAGDGLLYSDDGDGYGAWRLDRFHLERQGGRVRLRRESQGDFPLPYRHLRLQVHGGRARKVEVDGRSLEAADDGVPLPSGFAEVVVHLA